jgi:hypothetical protein
MNAYGSRTKSKRRSFSPLRVDQDDKPQPRRACLRGRSCLIRALKEEDGQMLPWMAFLVVAICGMAGLTLDLGRAWLLPRLRASTDRCWRERTRCSRRRPPAPASLQWWLPTAPPRGGQRESQSSWCNGHHHPEMPGQRCSPGRCMRRSPDRQQRPPGEADYGHAHTLYQGIGRN